jgi:nitroreductase
MPGMACDRPAVMRFATLLQRRGFLLGAAALGAMAGIALGRPVEDDTERSDYEAAARAIWRHSGATELAGLERQRELVRYATLAASNHNSQPWRFRIAEQAILVLPEFSRRGPAADYDGHELYVSLGCAAENLVQAAAAFGLQADARFDGRSGGIAVALSPAPPQRSIWFEAIPHRQSALSAFGGQAVAPDELRLLEAAAVGDGVRLLLLTEAKQLAGILDFVMAAVDAQTAEPAPFEELFSWVRFNYRSALATGDGLCLPRFGTDVLPEWANRLMFRAGGVAWAQKASLKSEVVGSAAIGVIAAERNDPARWVEAGRCAQRLALQATALGIQHALMCHPLETRALVPAFAASLGLGGWAPVAMIRFGYGPEPPVRSLRRPLDHVIQPA